MSPRIVIFLAAALGAANVALGAYHAHGFDTALKRAGVEEAERIKRLEQCGTGIRYQMFHSLALLGVGVLALSHPSRCLTASAICFLLGIALFCGGLYLMAFFDRMGHWAIVPAGGLVFLVGWLAVGAHVCCCWPRRDDT